MMSISRRSVALGGVATSFLPKISLAGGESPNSHSVGGESKEPVDLALVLAADDSSSIDKGRHSLQREGYFSAFTDPRVFRALTSGQHRAIALSFFYWAMPNQQEVVVPWTRISSQKSFESVANRLEVAPRPFSGNSTSIAGAIIFARKLFDSCPYITTKKTIDVSGDGEENNGGNTKNERDLAVASGIVINGLPIYGSPGVNKDNLKIFYNEEVRGGPGSFIMPADFETFGYAIVAKLAREIAQATGAIIT